MAHVVQFEICGLHYFLTCSDDPGSPGLRCRLQDEAFLGAAKAFSVRSREELFAKIETHVDMPLPDDLRAALRDAFEALDGPLRLFREMAATLGKTRTMPNPQGWDRVAVGMG